MDGDLYDEFGNYIGGAEDASNSSSSSSSSSSEDEDEDQVQVAQDQQGQDVEQQQQDKIIVLEKKYYPDADEVFGKDVEILVEDQDTQDIREPIIAPASNQVSSSSSSSSSSSASSFLLGLLSKRSLIRNVAVVGALHHGKSCFVREFFVSVESEKNARQISVRSMPVSTIAEDGRGKSYAINVLDCPGHVDFVDECTAGYASSDGVLLVVDVVEGVLMHTERLIQHALTYDLPVVLCLNKVDRLIHELKFPPDDAYYKLQSIIDACNHHLPLQKLCPKKGNVLFASSTDRWCFSLESFAKLHLGKMGLDTSGSKQFGRKLWGDSYFHEGKFHASSTTNKKAFVQFILEPLYKLYGQTLGESAETLKKTLKMVNVRVTQNELLMDPKPLVQLVMERFFDNTSQGAIVDAFVNHFKPQPTEQEQAVAKTKVTVTKMYPKNDDQSFLAFGRVDAGTLCVNDQVTIQSDDDNQYEATIASMFLPQNMPIKQAFPGNWVLIEGIDSFIINSASLSLSSSPPDVVNDSTKILRFNTVPTCQLAIEPLNPSELPRMIHGLRWVNKSYPLLKTLVQESGQHVLIGPGELYLDCVLHDLRTRQNIEVKVSDPVVCFRETVLETSAIKTCAETPNKMNKIFMIAQPLEKGLPEFIENHSYRQNNNDDLQRALTDQFDWDKLAVRSLWAFENANALVDDTVPTNKMLKSIKNSVVQGFQWATREGPLCDEPIRGVKFKILDAMVAQNTVHRGAGFVIPTIRKVCYSSYLTATPRLMEPVNLVEIQGHPELAKTIQQILRKRRGHIINQKPQPGTPFTLFYAHIPVIDAYGFETDLRTATKGLAFSHQVFHHWQIVPGDPLDETIQFSNNPLQPTTQESHLAREFCVKTRRRKGLPEQIPIARFFNDQNQHQF